MVIFDRKSLKPDMALGEVPGMMYGLSGSDWMDAELFESWFDHHLLAHAPPMRPLLLLIYVHSSHFDPGVLKKAAEERLFSVCLLTPLTSLSP